MKSWSISGKVLGLCTGLLGVTVIVAVFQYIGITKTIAQLDDVGSVQLPSTNAVMTIDLCHDTLRSVVYRAIYVSDKHDEAGMKDVANELKETTEEMRKSVEELGKLNIDEEIRKDLEDAKPVVDEYLKAGEEVTALALLGKTSEIPAKLAKYEEVFENAQKHFDKLEQRIHKDADATKEVTLADAHSLKTHMLMRVSVGITLGILMSLFFVKYLKSNLQRFVDQLGKSNKEVFSASNESATAASTLSEAATEQAASLQETMASVEEISAMINQNAESANKAKDAVELNNKVSDEGSRSVGDMLNAIADIKQTNDSILSQMESSNKEFAEIVKIISEIGEKTKVINDIVFQTKLLSFNASVEAARAGEHGKGFAVVAEEVGNLAQMSGNAAKEITDMLSDSIKKVNEIVDVTTRKVDQLVEVGKDKIVMGQSTAQKCREALDKIAENARTVSTMVSEISNASKEQAQGVQEINKAISQLDQVTQQNSAIAQKSSTQAANLNTEAKKLSDSFGELSLFVNGARGITSSTHHEVIHKETKHVEAKKPSHNDHKKVASLDSHRSKSIKTKFAKAPKAEKNVSTKPATKLVAGSDVVPSGDDPQFEDF